MVDITISHKQMKPGVIHTDQFENGVHVLRFTLGDYVQNNIDLRKFKAYVVTSLKGVPDVAEIPYTINGRQLILTWSISAYTLREPGIIQFQIKFAQSEDDATGVWWSYKGVVINRVSLNADDYVSAQYPTLMKQWLDLMHTLSGVYGAPVEYMMPGASVPVDNRLEGRMYYQWLDVPNRRAMCATGTVNLGERPYADSGLYINKKHICVDTTNTLAYAIDAATWVDAVNAAECGVIATDISSGGDIILLLTASTPGAAGNAITMQLTDATYGGGAGVTNPSGGHVSGATLVGGADATTGVSKPTGRLEDANGNILCQMRANYIANADLNKLVEHGEYICAGTMLNNPVSGNTYCMLHVTDSSSTSRVVQECYCVDMSNNSVRMFVRTVVGGSEFGAWRELATGDQITDLQNQLNGSAAKSHTHAISDVTNLQTTLNGKANSTHSHAISDVTNLQSTLNAKAPLASPALTGTPTAPTAASGTNTTQIATTAFVLGAVSSKQEKKAGTANMVLVTDANGNISASSTISTSELNALNGIGTTKTIESRLSEMSGASMVPDYSSIIAPSSPYTAPKNGYLLANGFYENQLNVTVNGVQSFHRGSAGSHGYETYIVPLAAGDIVTFEGGDADSFRFLPCK